MFNYLKAIVFAFSTTALTTFSTTTITEKYHVHQYINNEGIMIKLDLKTEAIK